LLLPRILDHRGSGCNARELRLDGGAGILSAWYGS
jgi:hypothetical protein